MGPLGLSKSRLFGPRTVLSCYAEDWLLPIRDFLMIGYETDDIMPLHLFYDFEHPSRDDARVVKMEARAAPVRPVRQLSRKTDFGKFVSLRVKRLPQACEGSFDGRRGDVFSQLDAVMAVLGFSKPVTTGSNCASTNVLTPRCPSVWPQEIRQAATTSSTSVRPTSARFDGFSGRSRARRRLRLRSRSGRRRCPTGRDVGIETRR